MYADDPTLLCSSSDPYTFQAGHNWNVNIAKINGSGINNLHSIKKTKLMIFDSTKHIFDKFDNI